MTNAPLDALPCPLCEYDLRGLPEPRCPECGYRFTPGELDDPARRFHPYLFEHHPRRNAWSFVRTLVGGLKPRTFWSTLHPTQPSRAWRLVLYWLACGAPMMAVVSLHFWLLATGDLSWVTNWRNNRLSPTQYALWIADLDVSHGAGYGVFALYCLAWPWLTLIALLVFQISLRRARLRGTHVLRCVLYAGDGCLWLILPLGFLVWTAWLASGWPPRAFFPRASAALPWFALGVFVYRLLTAYRLYLRFDHAIATVLASQVIVLLIYGKVWLVAGGF